MLTIEAFPDKLKQSMGEGIAAPPKCQRGDRSPQHEVPLALFMFNVGVETGQLQFITVVLSLMALFKRLPITLPQGSWRLMPYSIGSIAAFWTIERIASILV